MLQGHILDLQLRISSSFLFLAKFCFIPDTIVHPVSLPEGRTARINASLLFCRQANYVENPSRRVLDNVPCGKE